MNMESIYSISISSAKEMALAQAELYVLRCFHAMRNGLVAQSRVDGSPLWDYQ